MTLRDVVAPSASGCAVVGIPKSAHAACGLLVRDVPCGSPLAQAGVQRGDLLLALDGRPVADPESFRSAVESRAPGTTGTLEVWRDGTLARHSVTVGRERYRREGKITLALMFGPHADLNPFDDGIDVFGLVRAKSRDARYDLASVERDYLAQAAPGGAPALIQETTDVGVFPLYVGAQTQVLAQESVPPR